MVRGRKPKLTDDLKKVIGNIYSRHPDWSVRTIQKKIPEFNKSLIGKVPGRTLINTYIREVVIRTNSKRIEESGIDKLWSLASMSVKPEYELPAEVIPVVLETKRIRNKKEITRSDPDVVARRKELDDKIKQSAIPSEYKKNLLEGFTPGLFTIREAKWVARIYYYLKGRNTIEEMEEWAYHCAQVERDCQLAGINFDSTNIEFGMSFGDIGAYTFWALKMYSGLDDFDIGKLFGGEYFNNFRDLGFTPYGLSLFGIWYSLAVAGSNFYNFTEEEKIDWFCRLQTWVFEQEPVKEFNCPKELLGEIGYVTLWGSDLGIRPNMHKEKGGTK